MAEGLTFEKFKPGDRYRTGRRTVTESDVMQFVQLAGLFEPLFIDEQYIREESLFGERIAPGSLTFAMAEGLTVQTGIIHGTGMAFLGVEGMRLFRPVKIGNTIQVEIEVLDSKELKPQGGGIVRYRQLVLNQMGEKVMEYDAARMIRGTQRKKVERPTGATSEGKGHRRRPPKR
ncbi:MAG: MaoC/PaaZ C-terminal domain-containing protein [Candidatus Binatia bacterium]|jgi:acyl dehydratase|nr:MaoC/PaaZ C-terminal domain-containing protein [Candidatus Binatia bacterium]